ncbi:MAG: BrnT family toxin [Candidatus Humimicrobiaceae bacterium]
MDILNKLIRCTGFQWDEANAEKNWLKHSVTPSECEQIFFNIPMIVSNDEKHSLEEDRYYVLGKTDKDRGLFIAFTIRGNRIRIISARNMNKKERQVYDNYEKYS